MWRLAALLSVDQWSPGSVRTSLSCHRMQRNQGRPASRGWDLVDAGAVGTAGQRKQRQGSANATPGNMHLFGGLLWSGVQKCGGWLGPSCPNFKQPFRGCYLVG